MVNLPKPNVCLWRKEQKQSFFVLSQGRKLNLSFECHLRLFDCIVIPILLYGCEIWGFENSVCFENVHLRFLKYLTSLRKSTPNFMVYGEFGRFPLINIIKHSMICFWAKLLTGKSSKLCFLVSRLIFNDYIYGKCKHKRIHYLERNFVT